MEKNKYVYFIESNSNEFYCGQLGWSIDPLKALKFNSQNEAVEYIVTKGLDYKVTQHEFVNMSPTNEPVKEMTAETVQAKIRNLLTPAWSLSEMISNADIASMHISVRDKEVSQLAIDSATVFNDNKTKLLKLVDSTDAGQQVNKVLEELKEQVLEIEYQGLRAPKGAAFENGNNSAVYKMISLIDKYLKP